MTAPTAPVPPLPGAHDHVEHLVDTLRSLGDDLDRVERWGTHLADVLLGGGRLLAAGNGGSAADAQHLTAELVGRFRDDRQPLSALALHADTSSLTAIGNDYGYDDVFRRQVAAHGRAGDVLVAFSTSGTSSNVLEAVGAAHRAGMQCWALTGPGPNPLASMADDHVAVDAPSTATTQEVHGVLVHALCAAVDRVVLGVAATHDPGGSP